MGDVHERSSARSACHVWAASEVPDRYGRVRRAGSCLPYGRGVRGTAAGSSDWSINIRQAVAVDVCTRAAGMHAGGSRARASRVKRIHDKPVRNGNVTSIARVTSHPLQLTATNHYWQECPVPLNGAGSRARSEHRSESTRGYTWAGGAGRHPPRVCEARAQRGRMGPGSWTPLGPLRSSRRAPLRSAQHQPCLGLPAQEHARCGWAAAWSGSEGRATPQPPQEEEGAACRCSADAPRSCGAGWTPAPQTA
jgi:hypothetical protein